MATETSEEMMKDVQEEDACSKHDEDDDVSSGDESSDEEKSVAWAPTTPLIKILTEETHESFGVDGGDRFVLRDLLGQGGYGAVYRCSLEPPKRVEEAPDPQELAEAASQFQLDITSVEDGSRTLIRVTGPSMEGLANAWSEALSAYDMNITQEADKQDLFHLSRDGTMVPLEEVEKVRQTLTEAAGRCYLLSQEKASSEAEGRDYAVKIVNARRLAVICHCALEVVCPFIQQEVVIQDRLSVHPGIMKLKCAFMSQQSGKFFIVGELLRGGDLFGIMVRRGKPLKESEARHVMSQLCEAVCFCHTCGVAHRDLKLENCLVEDPKKLNVKVCDYGQSKFLDVSSAAQTLTTTPAYTAPEVTLAVREARPYNAFKADCFALGVILYCMLCNSFPRLEGYERDKVFKTLSEGAKDLIRKLLTEDAEARFSAKEALQHQWVQEKTTVRSVSKAPSHSTLASPTVTPIDTCMEAKVEGLVSCQAVIQAVQRERAVCCRVLAEVRCEKPPGPGQVEDDEEEQDKRGMMFWRFRTTDEQLAQATKFIKAVTVEASVGQGGAPWASLLAAMERTSEQLRIVRSVAKHAVQMQDASMDTFEDDLRSIYSAYHPLLSPLISAAGACFGAKSITATTDQGSRQMSPNTGVVNKAHCRYRMTALVTEQLSRERAFVSGFLHNPDLLKKPRSLLTMAEMIGARKLLLGNATTTSPNSEHVVAGAAGLMPELGLSETSPIDAADLAILEDAEASVLESNANCPRQAVHEWHDVLARLVDKTHQLVCLSIVEVLVPTGTTRSRSIPEVPSWASFPEQDMGAVVWEFHEETKSRANSECK